MLCTAMRGSSTRHPAARGRRHAELGHVAAHQLQLLVGDRQPRALLHVARGRLAAAAASPSASARPRPTWRSTGNRRRAPPGRSAVSTPIACSARATRRHSARATGARCPGQRGMPSGGCGSSWFQARLPRLPSSLRIAVGFGRRPIEPFTAATSPRRSRRSCGRRRRASPPSPVKPCQRSDRHVDIGRVELHRERDAAAGLGGDDRGPRSGERLVDRLAGGAVVQHRPAHRLDRLLGAVHRRGILVAARDLPERGLPAVAVPVALALLAPRTSRARAASGSRRGESTSRSLAQMICERIAKPQASRLSATVVACSAPCQT